VAYQRVLVLGGARSGKSQFAERLAAERGEPVFYVATAKAMDDEMEQRIAHHRVRRPAAWSTLEAQTEVAVRAAAALRELAGQLPALMGGSAAEVSPDRGPTLLVEDLTLLLSNLMAEDEASAEARATAELEALLDLEAGLILVSNEVGMGLVPEYPLGRRFRDALGRLNQFAASACDEVYLVVAGLPLRLK
jgi:adenosylcobinamide kinase/adenosylcobinamide-phosphate guanylyltransferase